MRSIHTVRMWRFHLVAAVAAAALAHASACVAQQPGRGSFDHLRTSFPLTGVHAVTPCETCHIAGRMAGTPRQCEFCHRAGSGIASTFKPPKHVPTNEPCQNCHRSAATWLGARYSHVSAAPGTCMSCHNGSFANGKPAKHVVTAQSCDGCHRTVAWLPATGFSHTGVVPGTCGTCHVPGGPGLAKPANHIPHETQLTAGASMGCDRCHKSTTSFAIETMDHNNTQGNGAGFCRGCHATGTSYLGNMQKKSVTHQSSTATDCSQSGCHRPQIGRASCRERV